MSSDEHSSESGPVVVEEQRSVAVKMAFAVLIVATIAAYSNALTTPFVFDDHVNIEESPSIRQLWPIWEVFSQQSPQGAYVHGRPVVNLSLALNYAVGGLHTLPYHLTNLAIHILAGLTLLEIVRRTLALPSLDGRYERIATPLAFAIAAIWALHPLQTQAVTYVIQRYESMMGLFSLLSLYCVIRSDSSSQPRRWTVAAVVACFLAMGCKEVAASLPLVILLYDRAFLAGTFRQAWRRRQGLYLGLLAAWLGLAALLVVSGGRSQWSGFALPIHPLDYAMTQFGVILHYLRLSFWPYPQVFDYAWPIAETWGQVLPGAVVVLGLLAATAYALIRWPKWGLVGAWFFLILAPSSSVMPIADMAFEHRMYLSLAAVAVMAVLAVHQFFTWLFDALRVSPLAARWVEAAIAAVVLVALGAATYARNQVYHSERSLWQDVVEKAPHNARAHNNLGNMLLKAGQPEEAITHYRKALEISPRFVNAHCNLATALLDQGKIEEAIAECQKAIEIDPQCARAYGNLANILVRQNRLDEAMLQFRKAIRLDPTLVDLHNKWASALATQGKLDEAVARYRKALEVNPNSVEALNSLADLLAKQGKTEEVVALCRKALKLNPDLAEAHSNLAGALLKQGNFEEAILLCQQALELDPQLAEAHSNLGSALFKQGNVDAAILQCRQALEIKPQFADAHNNLANALVRQGKSDEALTHYTKALEIDPRSADAHYNLANLLNRLDKLDGAVEHYRKALEIDPRRAETYNNLGVVLEKRGRPAEAMLHYQEAVRINPQYAEAHGNLAMVFAQQGKLDEALVHLQKAVELQPGLVAGHCQLAVVLMDKGRLDEAVSHLQMALRIDPAYAEARYHLGRVYRAQGKSQEAIDQWREGLRAQPGAVRLLNILAWELATSSAPSVRNGAEAVGLAERARQLAGEPSAQLLDTLAAAYAETGQFPAAIRTAELALKLATKANDTRHVNALSARLKLYQAGSAFHSPAPPLVNPGK